jgi:alpha-tubulin suppressor-like RCC1 family protein
VRRGLRYLPAPAKGRRRLGLLGAGLLAVLTLVWQQQATLASYVDAEAAKATFTARTLEAIAPSFTTTAATATGTWDAATGNWATPNYVLTGATSSAGANASELYSGSALTFTQTVGGTSTTGNLDLTDISAGGTFACGIARGQVYCWGTNTSGALGLGSTTSTNTPTAVAGALAGKIVTDVTAGANHACAVAEGAAYCWGNYANGRTGTGASANVTTPTAVTASGVLSGKTLTAISAGGTHTCAVASGAAYCWGLNTNGQLGDSSTTQRTAPVAVTTAAGLLAGRTVTAISAGTSHSCAVADGLAFCWGLNTNGRIGDNGTTQRTAPVAVTTAAGLLAGRTVTAISAGNAHSCAVADALAYCWGLNTNGRLGDGTTTQRLAPVAVVGTVASVGSVTAISAGNTHSCAIANGTAHCWGAGGSGQVGNGSTTASIPTPVAVTASGVLSGRTLTSISAGTTFTCTRGATPGACWGLGTSGQLGNNASATSTTPVNVAITGPVCADGAVRLNATDCSMVQGTDYWGRLGYSIGSWTAPNSGWVKATTDTRNAVSPSASAKTTTSLTLGWNQVSELSKSYAEYALQRSTSSSGSNPVTVYKGGLRNALDRGGLPMRTNTLDASMVSAGGDQSCEILEGAVYCWGDNTNGELGTGNTTATTAPAAVVVTGVLAGKTVTSISAAMDNGGDNGEHTCVVADGGVYCWGLNTDGELGDGTTTQSTSPVQAGTITDATQVTTGYMHTCALTNGGQVYCWGDNSRGQLGDGSTTQRNSPVLVQGLLAGKTVTEISAGAAHTCAVADGAAYCWGSNVSGQLGINSSGSGTNSNVPVATLTTGVLNGQTVTEVAAGEAHSCVIAGGKAYCWGYNNNGQVGNGSTTLTTVPVAVSTTWTSGAALSSLTTGMYHTCIVAAGKAYCWGDNANGQVGDGSTTDRTAPVAVTTSGVLSGTVSQISAGELHTCAVSGTASSCWGYNSTGQLGDNSTTQRTAPVAVQAVTASACATGATLITPSTCSLAPGTTYYYRVKFTVDGNMSTTSSWVGVKTNS